MSDTCVRAKEALQQRFRELNPSTLLDPEGYMLQPEDNLLDPAWLRWIEYDYKKGSGSELDRKFRAVHSSAAMAANHFAPFKNRPQQLVLAGHRGFKRLAFEQQLPTGLVGTPPNLDVFLESPDTTIAIESKLTETLSRKEPEFSQSYERSKFPDADDRWWQFVETARRDDSARFLDIAQLVKHYLGLLCFLRSRPEVTKAVLMYLYWKPANADKFHEHERELEEFKARLVGSSRIDFVALSYPDLWREWLQEPDLGQHAEALTKRYSVEI